MSPDGDIDAHLSPLMGSYQKGAIPFNLFVADINSTHDVGLAICALELASDEAYSTLRGTDRWTDCL